MLRNSLRCGLAALLLAGICVAQPTQTLPRGYDTGVSTVTTSTQSSSSFPFNNTADHTWHWHYDSNEFDLQLPVIITELYVRTFTPGTAANAFDFPSVEITMASSPTDYSVAGDGIRAGHASAFAANLNGDATVVRPAGPWTSAMVTNTGGWMALGLVTPFVYDPSTGNDLVVEIRKCGTNTTWGQSILGASGTANTVGANRYGDQSSCVATTFTFSNNEFCPVVGLDYVPSNLPIAYEANKPEFSFTVDGAGSSGYTPAISTRTGPATGAYSVRIDDAGALSWDIAGNTLPLVPVGGGGVTLPGGAFVNLNLASFPVFFVGGAGPSYTNAPIAFPGSPAGRMDISVPYALGAPFFSSFQGILINPTVIDGVRLSSAVSLDVQ